MKMSLKSIEKYFFTLGLLFSVMIPILFPTVVFLSLLILFVSALSITIFSFISIQSYTNIVLFTRKRE
nr:hypothetical protein [uncultured Caproiciproducens sp.]